MRIGFHQNDLDTFPGQSLDGRFRKSKYDVSSHKSASTSTSSKYISTSRRVYKVLKAYVKNLIDHNLFTQCLEDWVLENSRADTTNEEEQFFRSPFSVDELRNLDFALEGVLFQPLLRMPCFPSRSENVKEDEYLALEDFLYTIVDGLWHTFWHKNGKSPYFVSCPRHPGFKFCTMEKAISRGRLEKVFGAALISKTGNVLQVNWGEVVLFALFKPDIMMGCELRLSPTAICEALFYGVHILLWRSLSNYKTETTDYVFVLVLDSKFGSVVKIGGDLGRLELNSTDPYQSMVEWIKGHAEVCVSPVDRIWNKLGNANWGDLGTLQVLLATFYSVVQWNGPPQKSIAALASDHSLRIEMRRVESCLTENEKMLISLQQANINQGEIVELNHQNNPSFRKQVSRLQLKQGEILLLEDQHQGQKSFQICGSLIGGNYYSYSAIDLAYPAEELSLYVGAHPSQLEPSWEDMSLWYQVQRQKKVLNIFKEQGNASKYLPEIIVSGRILHSGLCKKESPKGRCDHPCCGIPVLVTYPVGEPLSSVMARDGPFTSVEAIRCCRDCLAALGSSKMVNVQHGDICPENIVHVVHRKLRSSTSLYVPIAWGHAVLEDRDSPAINLQFSSSHAIQHRKLCPSSDAESLVYLIYFICGGTIQQQDSIESALQWRQSCWSKRVIQQKLGQVSAILKAFADYVDSLCGTPYPVDYDIWVKRMGKALEGSTERGKVVVLNLKDVAESSGISGGGNSFSS